MAPLDPTVDAFLIEVQLDPERPTEVPRSRLYGQGHILQIGAMCDEEVEHPELRLHVHGRQYHQHAYDKRYLSRIWPGLWTLPAPVLFDGRDGSVELYYPGRAVVVIVGTRTTL